MTRNNADFQGGQGIVISDGIAPGYKPEDNQRQLTLSKGGENKAHLMYHVDKGNVAYIDLVHSQEEGKGHATALIDHFYKKFPNENIDWGEIQHPAASHLYQKFSKRYGRSYSWDDEDW